MRIYTDSSDKLFFFVLNLNLSPFEIRGKNDKIGKNCKKNPTQCVYNKERFLENLILFFTCKGLVYPEENTFVLLIDQKTKWIYSLNLGHSEKHKNTHSKPFKIKKIFEEELFTMELEKEIEEYNGFKKKVKIFSPFFAIFYALQKIKKNNRVKNARLLTITEGGIANCSTFLTKNLISIGKKINGTFDSLVFFQDSFFLNILAFLTNGIYCKPIRFLSDIIYTKDFFQMLLTLFIFKTQDRQLFSLPMPTKILSKSIISENKEKGWYCSMCLTSFSSPFLECYLCGISFLI